MRDDVIFREIFDLIEQVYEYWRPLKLGSIWLLLATFGCWSILDKYLCLVALVIVGALFVEQILFRLPVRKSFAHQIKDLLGMIDESTEITADQKGHYREEIDIIKTRILGFVPSFRSNWVFILCFLFYGLTVYYWFVGKIPG